MSSGVSAVLAHQGRILDEPFLMWADLCLKLDIAQAFPQEADERQSWRNWTGERHQRLQGCLKAEGCSNSSDTVAGPEGVTAHSKA